MWYYCESCGSLFMSEDVRIIREEEYHPGLDGIQTEYMCYYACPECGSTCLEEADYCEICGEPMVPDSSWDGLCEACRREEEKDG